MTAPDAARPAESVKDVLLHALLRDEFGRHYDEIMAGPSGESWREGDMKAKARRHAAALAEAGIGSLAQARAEAGERIAAESLTLLMQAWGCGPGEIVTETVGADVDGVPGEIPIGQLCKSSAHNYAYWGQHCGFAGNAAGLVVIAAQNVAARAAAQQAATPQEPTDD
jgi:hypothetical protein